MSGKIIIFGIGYVGRHLAESLLKDGWEVVGTCRSHSTRDELKKIGLHAEIFDGTTFFSNWEEFSLGATQVLIAVPPQNGKDVVYAHYLPRLSAMKLAWLGYLSTTGVYGDHAGEWVDEESETRAVTDRAKGRLDAEKAWSNSGLPAHIFRLSGIYGPGRSVIDNLYQGTARNIIKDKHYLSRIHIADIVQALTASIHTPQRGRIYNLADNEPSSASEVVEYAAQIMGLPAPPRVEAATATLSDTAQDFYENNKRVRNDRLKTELGVQLKYPTYREGLRAVLARRIASSGH